MINDSTRSATAIALLNCSVIRIDKNVYNTYLKVFYYILILANIKFEIK